MKLLMVTVYESHSLNSFKYDWDRRIRIWTKGGEDEVNKIFNTVVNEYRLKKRSYLNEAAGLVENDYGEVLYMYASTNDFTSGALEERFPDGVLYCDEISWPFDLPKVETESCSNKLDGVLDCIKWRALM